MDDLQVCSSWEEIEENSSLLDQQLEKLKLEKAKLTAAEGQGEPKIRILTRKVPEGIEKKNEKQIFTPQQPMVLDSTREESMRSQYVPPEPRITLLTRPKANNTRNTIGNGPSSKSQQPVKTLEQREKEYMEARMRILGDVNFEEPEDEQSSGSDGSNLSPAEILKQKIAQAMKQEDDGDGCSDEGKNSSSGSGDGAENSGKSKSKSKSRGKRSREKLKTSNPESPRDFPVSKSDSTRILRQPRGPDGTMGFQLQR